jgi:hypothetical protein
MNQIKRNLGPKYVWSLEIPLRACSVPVVLCVSPKTLQNPFPTCSWSDGSARDRHGPQVGAVRSRGEGRYLRGGSRRGVRGSVDGGVVLERQRWCCLPPSSPASPSRRQQPDKNTREWMCFTSTLARRVSAGFIRTKQAKTGQPNSP